VIEEIDADTLIIRMAAWKTVTVDVRDRSVFPGARIPEALSIPLSELAASIRGLPLETSVSLVCETGVDCSLGASILWKLGYRKLAILRGGFANNLQLGLPVTA
jgi:rhodanese-related sulfurtransferase